MKFIMEWTTHSGNSSATEKDIRSDADGWMNRPYEAVPVAGWRFEFINFYADVEMAHTQPARALQERIEKAGCDAFPVVSGSNTIEFDRLSDAGGVDDVASYTITDNVFGIFWEWRPLRRTTRGLMYCCNDEGSRQIRHILDNVSRNHDLWPHPQLIAMLTVEAEVIEMKNWIEREVLGIQQAQVQTGYHSYETDPDYKLVDSASIDLTTLSREICGLAVNIATSSLCMHRLIKLTDFIHEENKDHETVTCTSPNISIADLGKRITRRLRSLKRKAENLHEISVSLQSKAEIMVQTMYTLVARRDQEAAIKLAEQATKDSTSMKAIAAVTMCFLPGTFMASLFDMPLLDFSVPAGHNVSGQFWIYWAVTIPLTALVVSIWLAWAKQAELRVRGRSLKAVFQARLRHSTHDTKTPRMASPSNYPVVPGEELRNRPFLRNLAEQALADVERGNFLATPGAELRNEPLTSYLSERAG